MTIQISLLINLIRCVQLVMQNVRVIAANNKTLFEEDLGSDDHIKISNKFLTGSGGFAPEIILISSEQQGTTILEVSNLKQKPEILEGGMSKLNDHDVYLTTDRNIYRQADTVHAWCSTAVRSQNVNY